jgi:hypothetical protein
MKSINLPYWTFDEGNFLEELLILLLLFHKGKFDEVNFKIAILMK